MKNVIHLRCFSLVANLIYILYCILLNAPPFIIGCSIAVLIHTYHLYRLLSEGKPHNGKRTV
ncbi:MAG: hypothetical protein AAGD05_07225 [Bacteroidota bacterium]